jgi:Eco57I restriction-modification methylase
MSRAPFTAIKTEGGLLPRETLQRVANEDGSLPGMRPKDYHLAPNERLGEAINRAWNRLLGFWETFSDELGKRAEGDAATGLTRDRWLLPLFEELGYGRLQRSAAVEIDGKSFAISHAWYHTPIHLVGAGVSIDKRSAGVAGAATAAPHSLVQEFLNRSSAGHLWAFVSNGRLLRILRDSHSLSRQAYVEFDLEAIMDGELFSDFRVLWLVCHESRVEAEKPEDCFLESWFQESREEGVRALDALRDGVEKAIKAFGSGFLRHPGNDRLHEGLRSGELDRQDYYRELLRLVYRLIFLFVAEDRDALLDPNAGQAARQRYTKFYASNRLRELAGRRRGTAHDDLWRGLRLVLSKLHNGCPELGLPALGSFLWSPEAVEWIGDVELRNDDLLAALRALCYTTQDHQLLPVNWRTLGSEELGSIYESLLELHPKMNREAGTFELETAAGHERKTTGSYYTPTSLVDRLLNSALEPVLEEAMRAHDPEAALLDLKVCDTAAGSGHFLVAAARRIALRLASVRTGDEEASPEAVTHALRDVVGRCIYGVDLNPLAVELCKVSLWMEALEPGKPLSFLDHHIQLGNSLLGTTPHLLREGIPDDAFKALEGDDKQSAAQLRQRNQMERETEQIGFLSQLQVGRDPDPAGVTRRAVELDQADDSTIEAIADKRSRFRDLVENADYRRRTLAADAWCAAFFWVKVEGGSTAITEDVFRSLQKSPDLMPKATLQEVERLSREYRFFHFHLAFPEVFDSTRGATNDQVGWPGGFDVVLGNPPWERLKLQDKEYFAETRPDIAAAPNAAKRAELIAQAQNEDPELWRAYEKARRASEATIHIVRNSGRYPLCGRGDINTYSVFSELDLQVIRAVGRVGIVVPTGIATDTTTKLFFQRIVDKAALVSLYDFENRAQIFKGVHGSYKFSLLTLSGGAHAQPDAEFAFYLRHVSDLNDPERRFRLSADDIARLNPNTRTCPIFRNRRDAEITKAAYRRVPVLLDRTLCENPWEVSFRRLFNSTNDVRLFKSKEQLEVQGFALVGNRFERGSELWLPVYEAKMVSMYDHRAADVVINPNVTTRQAQPDELSDEQHRDTARSAIPRWWVPRQEVLARLPDPSAAVLLGICDITAATNRRSMLACLLPVAGATDTLPIVVSERPLEEFLLLLANFNSFAYDYLLRQGLGGLHLSNYLLEQAPTIPPDAYSEPVEWVSDLRKWIVDRVFALTYTSQDMQPLASALGVSGQPRHWDPVERQQLKCELDAVYFHLYGMSESEVDYIMETFPVVKKADVRQFGEYRTKLDILELFKAHAEGRTCKSA